MKNNIKTRAAKIGGASRALRPDIKMTSLVMVAGTRSIALVVLNRKIEDD